MMKVVIILERHNCIALQLGPKLETDHNDDDDLLHLEDSHKLESDDEDDEVDNNIGTIIIIIKCIAQSWLVPVQETDQ